MKHHIYAKILLKKASKSICHYKIAALGINAEGRIIGCTYNKPRFNWKGGGIHAEISLMKKYGKQLKTIYILRIGSGGDIRPIEPCKTCKEKADELNIKIKSLCKN